MLLAAQFCLALLVPTLVLLTSFLVSWWLFWRGKFVGTVIASMMLGIIQSVLDPVPFWLLSQICQRLGSCDWVLRHDKYVLRVDLYFHYYVPSVQAYNVPSERPFCESDLLFLVLWKFSKASSLASLSFCLLCSPDNSFSVPPQPFRQVFSLAIVALGDWSYLGIYGSSQSWSRHLFCPRWLAIATPLLVTNNDFTTEPRTSKFFENYGVDNLPFSGNPFGHSLGH